MNKDKLNLPEPPEPLMVNESFGCITVDNKEKQLNSDLSSLIKKNYNFIKNSSPTNPSISKDDEW